MATQRSRCRPRAGKVCAPSDTRATRRRFFRPALLAANALSAQDISRVRLLGHSMGAATAMIFADVFGEMFQIEHLALICPAGVQVDGLLNLARRARNKGRDDRFTRKHGNPDVQNLLRLALRERAKYFANVPRTLSEAWALGRTPLLEVLIDRFNELGIPITLFYSEDDLMFNSNALLETAWRLGIRVAELPLGVTHDPQFAPVRSAKAIINAL